MIWRRSSKYKAQPTIVDGIRFDSKKEAKRYSELKFLEMAGEISDLQLQVRFPLVVNKIKVCTYIADFVYMVGDTRVVEDTKGYRTDVYQIKKKMMEAIYDIQIRES